MVARNVPGGSLAALLATIRMRPTLSEAAEVAARRLMRFLRRVAGDAACSHLAEIHAVTPRSAGCEECLETGEGWVALHLCLTCGHVGCCVSSPGAHAKKHHQETGHPIIQSVERGWRWCYPDKTYV